MQLTPTDFEVWVQYTCRDKNSPKIQYKDLCQEINVPVSIASVSPYISISLASVFQHECDGEEDGSNVVTAAAHNSIIKSSKKKRESKGRKEKEGRSKEWIKW